MGLDMYLNGILVKVAPDNLTGKAKEAFERLTNDEDEMMPELELGYWRKHANLHGFIVQRFGGGDDQCQVIWLTVENLEEIVKATNEKRLPPTSGFFFGQSREEDDADTLKIVAKALEWVKGGDDRRVYYQASW